MAHKTMKDHVKTVALKYAHRAAVDKAYKKNAMAKIKADLEAVWAETAEIVRKKKEGN